MTIYAHQHGFRDGVASHDALRAMAQFQALLALDAVAPITDNIGGTADAENDVVTVAAAVANAAASGSDLAGKATTEAAFETVRDALVELYAKANSAAAKVGVSTITYNGGGTAADGTAAAVTVSVTGAATGGLAANINTFLTSVDSATYNLALFVNKIAKAAGTARLVPGFVGTPLTTVPAIVVDTGTAADPGVKKSVVDAKLVLIRTNLKTISTALAATLAGVGAAPVVAV